MSTGDIHVARSEPLAPPGVIRAEFPASDEAYDVVVRSRAAIRRIISGHDPRLLAVVGPCSIHDPDAAREYAWRLRRISDRIASRILVVMRVYFEKPRTTVGWKGLINDPHLDGTHDVNLGLRLARQLLVDLAALGVPAATEILDPITPQYTADLVSWAAIGARTTESQTHREMASGLSMPVGFKNSTDGNERIAINAMESARHPHTFVGIDETGTASIVHTTGNPHGHVILRGGRRPNYDRDSILACEQLLVAAGLPSRILLDCSHGQTQKDFTQQPHVLRDVIRQVRAGNGSIMGFMLESNLQAGSQRLTRGRSGLKYGMSITDECIDWDTTQRCLLDAAAAAVVTGSPR